MLGSNQPAPTGRALGRWMNLKSPGWGRAPERER